MLRFLCCLIKHYASALRIEFMASCHGRFFPEKNTPFSIGYEDGLYQV